MEWLLIAEEQKYAKANMYVYEGLHAKNLDIIK